MPSSKHTKYIFQGTLFHWKHYTFGRLRRMTPHFQSKNVLWRFLFHNARACCKQANISLIKSFVLEEEQIQKSIPTGKQGCVWTRPVPLERHWGLGNEGFCWERLATEAQWPEFVTHVYMPACNPSTSEAETGDPWGKVATETGQVGKL